MNKKTNLNNFNQNIISCSNNAAFFIFIIIIKENGETFYRFFKIEKKANANDEQEEERG